VTLAEFVRWLATLLDELEAVLGHEAADELRSARRSLARLARAAGL
jgi:hypothetical protein